MFEEALLNLLQQANVSGLPALDFLIAADVRSSYKGHALRAISTIVSRPPGVNEVICSVERIYRVAFPPGLHNGVMAMEEAISSWCWVNPVAGRASGKSGRGLD
jgi:uncharacterized UPF0146 family protein